ncbi:hypothetical protein BST30_17360 [Mycobacterium mantenii]|uniref:Uncharacterized protein n=1 Tax=Mycobacterium mantenii TaxID=560555 RepID=A0A1X0FQW6_MYCNT|nr:hypothetical protein BST30_17360 [Mycobacterium mantenii]
MADGEGLMCGKSAGGGSASGGSSDGPCARKPMACAGACGTSILSLPGGRAVAVASVFAVLC